MTIIVVLENVPSKMARKAYWNPFRELPGRVPRDAALQVALCPPPTTVAQYPRDGTRLATGVGNSNGV